MNLLSKLERLVEGHKKGNHHHPKKKAKKRTPRRNKNGRFTKR